MTESHAELLRREFDEFYAAFDDGVERFRALVPVWKAESAALDKYARKARLIRRLCELAPVHVWRNTPLFFEACAGKKRHTWGGWCIGLDDEEWKQPYLKELEWDRENGFLWNWANPVGMDHHCPDYDRFLRLGGKGLIREAEAAAERETDEGKRAFYAAAADANRSLLLLAERFSAEARRLAAEAPDEETRAHYAEIADTAARVPAEPPRTFREALNAVFFYRENLCALEGFGVSTFAQMDRYLWPYYEADRKAGRVTPEEAKKLFGDLLLYTAARFEIWGETFYETSTTIELGGCDREGNVVYNELTRLILEAAEETEAVASVNTKLNCRVSSRHPREFFKRIAAMQLKNMTCLMLHNDDVIIPARVRHGQEEADARLYVGCGCHEVVLSGSEVCTRADTWLNVPRILLKTLSEHTDAPDWESFYHAFLEDLQAYHVHIEETKNKYEAHWSEHSPLPLYSSSFASCIEKGKDVTEGGAKYNSTALSMTGAATAVDSLYTIRKYVFESGKLTLAELLEQTRTNFAGSEPLRQSILRGIAKYGSDDAEMNGFAARVLHDMSGVSGRKNARGGLYYPAFYPHSIYVALGEKTPATPDGRPAGLPLSRGGGPSETTVCSPTDILRSVRQIDFTDYTDSFVLDVGLPEMRPTPENVENVTAIIEGFLAAGGSAMQFNMLRREDLLDARAHPERHANLYVRVCGFSARYTSLSDDLQREILNRAIR